MICKWQLLKCKHICIMVISYKAVLTLFQFCCCWFLFIFALEFRQVFLVYIQVFFKLLWQRKKFYRGEFYLFFFGRILIFMFLLMSINSSSCFNSDKILCFVLTTYLGYSYKTILFHQLLIFFIIEKHLHFVHWLIWKHFRFTR